MSDERMSEFPALLFRHNQYSLTIQVYSRTELEVLLLTAISLANERRAESVLNQ